MSSNDDIPDFYRHPCQKNGHNAIFKDNILYALGGYEVTAPFKNGTRLHLTSSYLRTFDFTKDIDLSTTPYSNASIQSMYHLPFRVPHAKWATLWASKDGKNLNFWGGNHEVSAILTGVREDGSAVLSNDVRPPIDNSIWQIPLSDLSNEESWKKITVKEQQGKVDPLMKSAYAVDNNGVLYSYGGVYEKGGYALGNGTRFEPQGKTEGELPRQSLITVDLNGATATNHTDVRSPAGVMKQGAMHYIPSVGEKGVMVLLGGEGESGGNIDIHKVWILDIATQKWYTQPTTAEAGNFPADRLDFCSVLVSAEDGSSHNIFITGGLQQPNLRADAFDDVFVLSLPSFRWIYLGRAQIAKTGATCNTLGKYLIMYGGRRNNDLSGYNNCEEEDIMQFYDMEKLEWTNKFDAEASKATWKVPKTIYDIVGGSGSGGATSVEPKDGFVSNDLKAIFAAKTTENNNSNNNSSGNSTDNLGGAPNGSSSTKSKMNVGALAGGLVGALVLIALLSLVLFLLRRNKKLKKNQSQNGQALPTHAGELHTSPIGENSQQQYAAQPLMSPMTQHGGNYPNPYGSPPMGYAGHESQPPQYVYVESKPPPVEPVEMQSNIHAQELDATPRS